MFVMTLLITNARTHRAEARGDSFTEGILYETNSCGQGGQRLHGS